MTKQGVTCRRPPYTSDDQYTAAELEYLMQVDRYRDETGRRFLCGAEYLAVARAMGYRQVYRISRDAHGRIVENVCAPQQDAGSVAMSGKKIRA